MITHDEQRRRFSETIDEKECFVEYDLKETSPRSIDVYRTFVHPDLRGRGIAESLIAAVTEYAAKGGLKVIPSCSYAVTWYHRHPEHSALIAEHVNPEYGGSCRLK
jgi:predicted GNAT family acetyltransferase